MSVGGNMVVHVTVITPFAQIDGILEFPEERWMECALSTKAFLPFRPLQRLNSYHGVYNGWQLKLYNLQSFLDLVGKGIDDIWLRLRTTEARIQVDMNHRTDDVNHIDRLKSLVSSDDEVILGDLVSKEKASMLHLTISLMSDQERMVDDATVRFCYEGPEETCCICLEQMCPGDMLRRLPCLHDMHAGCAMNVLPKTGSCPLCRGPLLCSLHACSLGMPDQAQTSSIDLSGNFVVPPTLREGRISHGNIRRLPDSRMVHEAEAYRVSSAPPTRPRESGGPGELREASRPVSSNSRREHAADLLPSHPDERTRSSSRSRRLLARVKSALSKVPSRIPRIPWGRRSEPVHSFTGRPETA